MSGTKPLKKNNNLNKKVILLVGIFIISTAYAAWIDRMERKMYGVKPGVYIEEHYVGQCLLEEVEPVVDELVIKHRSLPQNPRLDRKTGAIIPEQLGCEIDAEATIKQIFAAPPDTRVHLVKKEVKPAHNADELKEITHSIGYYQTWFYGSWQRHQNIFLALLSINNLIVWPKEEFSFNEAVGPRTPERGYRLGPVMGGDGLGFGGGVCQASTTLYNAALNADLKIVERHPHSSRVPYVPAGQDATVVFGAQDLRFVNQFDYPIIIKASIYRGKISVSILGKER